jgi:hypothetical protein
MARGWESKSIESQQADATADRTKKAPLTPEALAVAARRRELNLSKSRVVADLERATAPAHREMLQQALAALDDEIKKLEQH